MKRILLLSLGLVFLGSIVSAQYSATQRASVNPLKDYAVEKLPAGDRLPPVIKPYNHTVSSKGGNTIDETVIGETRYDLQTNTTTTQRFWVYEDGTAAAVWTMGLNDAGGYPDRGTGYNYFDGTSWGPAPSTRVESVRTGWPSYAPYDNNGEVIVSHDFAATGGLVISMRSTKGTGSWTQSTFTGPAGHTDVAWPRMVTSGPNNEVIHMIYVTKSTVNGGTPYNGLEGAILYSRSSDGGLTWNPQNEILTGMTSTNYYGFSADGYTWAAPKGDTLAFVVADSWVDMFMMKSTDGGFTWTKTVIWEHPYPLFNLSSPTLTDTFYCPDGTTSLALDGDGMAHLAFGVNRAHSDGTGTFYFPFIDGIAYWNESMPAFASNDFKQTLNPDSLYNSGHLVAWTQDINGNDTLDFLPGSIEILGTYFTGLSSMPSLIIDEEEGNIGMVYSSVTEGLDNGIQNFRHIWSTYKLANESWSEDFYDVTSSIIHNFDECVFPILAPTSLVPASNNEYYAQMIYQADEEPGLSVRGDEDAPTDNDIIQSVFPIIPNVIGIPEGLPSAFSITEVYPNPASSDVSVELNLIRKADITVQLFSLSGQVLKSMPQGMVMPGKKALNIDVSNLSQGIYFLSITDGDYSITRKLILQ